MFRRGWRAWILPLFVCVAVIAFVLIGSYCNGGLLGCSSLTHNKNNDNNPEADTRIFNKEIIRPNVRFPQEVLSRDYDLDLEDEDVLVFLHIQKTGGSTFGKHLVNNLDLEKPCNCKQSPKKCDCLTRKKTLWLFSRYSTGWACGLHADWTELKTCVDHAMDKQERQHRQRRYHYITILRDPVSRYMSEYRHVLRGATWKTARLFCNGRQATLEEVPFCYEGKTWEAVDLDSFLSCKFNLASNRQTRMLANLSKINCYNRTGITDEERDKKMLESAIENLKNFSFFGLTEFQHETQFLFENTFNLKFISDFDQFNTTAHMKNYMPNDSQMARIKEVNKLDVMLYEFANNLFKQRLEQMKKNLKENPDNQPTDKQTEISPNDS